MLKPLRPAFVAAMIWATAPSANANVDFHENIWDMQSSVVGGSVEHDDHSVDQCAAIYGAKTPPILLASMGKKPDSKGDVVIEIGDEAVVTSGNIIAVLEDGELEVASRDGKPIDASKYKDTFFDKLAAAEEVCAKGNTLNTDAYDQIKRLKDAAVDDFNYVVDDFNALTAPTSVAAPSSPPVLKPKN